MKDNKKYWKGLEELRNEPDFVKSKENEFAEDLPVVDSNNPNEASRRDFLKAMGFSVAAVSLAACEAPVRKAIPYVNKPETVDPGIPNYYASSFAQGGKYCSIVVKTREGRPIKIEGNKESKISKGGVDAQVHASILDLYDSARLRSFQKNGSDISKELADKEIISELTKISEAGGKIRLVTESIFSPSTKRAISEFIEKYPGTKHVTFDAISAAGILKANGGVVPDYKFEKAKSIVSIGADFLSTWLSSIEYSKGYSANRKVTTKKAEMSRHFQFESILTVTGSNADYRTSIKPSEEGKYVVALYNEVASKLGASSLGDVSGLKSERIQKAAADLVANKGKSLVVSGSNDVNVQVVVAQLNELLGNVGSTVSFDTPLLTKQDDGVSMNEFRHELAASSKGKSIDAVIFFKSNFVYQCPDQLEDVWANIPLKVAITDREDETASVCDYICPTYHYLESWGDVEPKKGSYSLIQPTISPVFQGTRQAEENLLVWSGNKTSYYDYVQGFWKKLASDAGAPVFDIWWNTTLQLGVYEAKNAIEVVEAAPIVVEGSEESVEEEIVEEVVSSEGISLEDAASKLVSSPRTKGFELLVYANSMIGDGSFANNPWLQELPDPMTKVTWDNYLSVSIADAEENGWKDGDVVSILVIEKAKVKLPVIVQPGQAKGVVAVAMGYGRKKAGKLRLAADAKRDVQIRQKNTEGTTFIGVDVTPLLYFRADGTLCYSLDETAKTEIQINKDSEGYQLGRTQTAQTLLGRGIVRETNLDSFVANPGSIKEEYDWYLETTKGKQRAVEVDVWAAPASTTAKEYKENFTDKGEIDEIITHEYPNHHWGMVIDMNSCTGCSACMVSCQVENNVPVVGKDEVVRKRDMEWIRIDRYYSSNGDDSFKSLETAEKDADDLEVVFQPMMCQHCNHAPCETVCPVAATTHSTEGLNQMTYNRCIGTRYCANNCPYKVRRFNWFNYSDTLSDRDFKVVNTPMNDDLGKMVLNPDVTVRARGVMEKCSMCVQRIQYGKLQAKIDGRRPEDGDIDVACASSCPTDAITFGDMNNPNSAISKVLEKENAERSYHVLDELNVRPNITYLAKVRNK